MNPSDDPAADDPVFDDVREAATDVIASLKKLIEATERVVQDPQAFARVVDGGRSVVEAFVSGVTGVDDTDADTDDEGGES